MNKIINETAHIYYDFSSKLIRSTFHASPIDKEFDDFELFKGYYKQYNKQIVFKQCFGNKLTDILDTGFVSLFLISERMKNLLQDCNLTGWKSYPALLYDKKNNVVPGYSVLSIVGRCNDIDYQKSAIIEKHRIPTGPLCKFYKGIVIEGWDGSDFFSPQSTSDIFVTERAANILKINNISNLVLENLVDYEVSVSTINIATRK